MEIDTQKPIVIEIKKSRIEKLANAVKIVFKGLITIFIITIIAGAFSQKDFTTTSFQIKFIDWDGNAVAKKDVQQNIAFIPIYGIIASERNNLFDITPSESILQMLDAAEKDESVKIIVLNIDSPGGTVFDSDKIALKIKEVKKSKKVYALLESMATSGGYFIASACDKIFAYEETITGSIGVVMEFPNAKKLMDKAGVEIVSITSGNMKTMGSPFEELTDEQRDVFTVLVNDAYDKFVNYVSEGRSIEKEKIINLADGRIFSGSQALSLNLIDGARGVEDLKSEIKSQKIDEYNILKFYVPVSAFEKVFGPVSQTINNLFKDKKMNATIMFYK